MKKSHNIPLRCSSALHLSVVIIIMPFPNISIVTFSNMVNFNLGYTLQTIANWAYKMSNTECCQTREKCTPPLPSTPYGTMSCLPS